MISFCQQKRYHYYDNRFRLYRLDGKAISDDGRHPDYSRVIKQNKNYFYERDII